MTPTVIASGEYITITQAARLAGYSAPGNLRMAAAQGKLQSIKVGPRQRLTTKEWLEEYLSGLAVKEGWERGKSRRRPSPQEPDPAEEQS